MIGHLGAFRAVLPDQEETNNVTIESHTIPGTAIGMNHGLKHDLENDHEP